MIRKKYTCLQLTNTCIRVVRLRCRHGKWEVTRKGEKPLHVSKEKGDPFHHPNLAQTVRELLMELSVRQKRVLLSIPGDGVLLKCSQIPAFEHADASLRIQAIEADLPNQISLALEEAAYDWTIVNPTQAAPNLLTVWTRKESLVSLISQLKAVDITPLSVVPSSIHFANQLLSLASSSQKICGIQTDGREVDLVVIEDGQLIGGRSFLLDTNLWQTLKRSLAPYQADLQRIVLFHPTSSDRLTPEQVQRHLGIACEIHSTGDNWAGALLNGYLGDSGGISINLLKPILRQEDESRRQRQRHQAKRVAPIAVAIGLMLGNLGVWHGSEATRLQIEQLQQVEERANRLKAQRTSMHRKKETLKKQLAALAWGARDFPPLAERLVKIAAAIPKPVRLTEIRTLEPPRSLKNPWISMPARRCCWLGGLTPRRRLMRFGSR
ncbi:MAG: pilus assembly protein PilM [Candidatus Poribacteria bacterium]|nr:pilus assembly protein PilM [Candidatus Poribacteria bacterium]